METVIKTKEDVKALAESPECISVMTAVFEAIAFCETIRSIVEPKQQELVDFFKFKVRDEFKERRGIEIIEKPSHMYLADEQDWELYNNEMITFYKENGLKHKEGCCPLLEAESLVREVKQHAIDILEPFTGVSWDMLCWNIKQYEKYIDLQLTLFAPIVKSNLNQK